MEIFLLAFIASGITMLIINTNKILAELEQIKYIQWNIGKRIEAIFEKQFKKSYYQWYREKHGKEIARKLEESFFNTDNISEENEDA